jgi:hypothetical protein
MRRGGTNLWVIVSIVLGLLALLLLVGINSFVSDTAGSLIGGLFG